MAHQDLRRTGYARAGGGDFGTGCDCPIGDSADPEVPMTLPPGTKARENPCHTPISPHPPKRAVTIRPK